MEAAAAVRRTGLPQFELLPLHLQQGMCPESAASGLVIAEPSASIEMMLATAAHPACTSSVSAAKYYSANVSLVCHRLQHHRCALAVLCRVQTSRV
jgi:hypothetical protein